MLFPNPQSYQTSKNNCHGTGGTAHGGDQSMDALLKAFSQLSPESKNPNLWFRVGSSLRVESFGIPQFPGLTPLARPWG